ncbi:MAG TPA: PaaI family thioesterase [Thermoanaerobaculia bacterium]|nr:PaaI family thioesterase [Thermoanaerobaculia bacterium]
MTPRDPGFEARVRESFARQAVMDYLGATMTRVEPGLVEIELPFRPELTQQHGYFHGGVVAIIADSAAGYAGYSMMPTDSSVLSVEYKINMVAPADGDRLRATGQVVRSGRTLTVCEFRVTVTKDGAETVCAIGTETVMCLMGRPDR